MAFDAAQTPDTTLLQSGNASVLLFRKGSPAGDAWTALARAENAERMAKRDRLAALPSVAEQVAALQVEMARHRALAVRS